MPTPPHASNPHHPPLAFARGAEGPDAQSETALALGAMTLGQALARCVSMSSGLDLLVFPERRLTPRALEEESGRLARGLLQLGIQRGEHVAVLMPNLAEYCVAEFALARIGAAMVPVNIRYKVSELAYTLHQSDAVAVVLTPRFLKSEFLAMLREICPELGATREGSLSAEALPRLRHVIVVGEAHAGLHSYEDFLCCGDEPALAAEFEKREAAVRSDDVVLLQYTSGSTAFPKAVMLSHGQVLRNAFQMAQRAGIGAEDRVLSAMPMFHVGGSVAALLGAVTRGYTLYNSATFDAGETLRLIEEEQITTYIGLESMFIALRNHEDFTRRSRAWLRKGWAAGTDSILRMVAEEIGIRDICSLFGLSEASPNVCIADFRDPYEKRITTMGRPQPGVEVKIADPVTFAPLPRGMRGEICVRGWSVMRGYYKKPEETTLAIDAEGWLHTGDLGFMDDDGFVTWTGRRKDMLRIGGENVSAVEVENFLCGHPKIQAAAVVGVPDERWGEVILAFVKLRPGETATEEEILAYCKPRIAVFKVPRYIRFVREFEMTGSGKIQKYVMRERALAELKKS